MLHILLMKIGSTVLLLIPYRFHIVFEPARLRIACRQVRLSVCRQAGTPADRSAGKLDGRQAGRQAGWSAGRLAGQRAYACVLRVTRRLFGYCRKVAARYVSSYSKHFGLLPKTLPPGCLSEVGQPVQTCGVLGLFLVLYTVLFHLTI